MGEERGPLLCCAAVGTTERQLERLWLQDFTQ